MSKLKMLKQPKKPKLPKKPKATASLSSKQSYLRRVKDLHDKYNAKVRAVVSENEKRKKINRESERLSNVIAGIGDITTTRPSAFKTYTIRKKRTSAVKRPKKKAKKAAKRRR